MPIDFDGYSRPRLPLPIPNAPNSVPSSGNLGEKLAGAQIQVDAMKRETDFLRRKIEDLLGERAELLIENTRLREVMEARENILKRIIEGLREAGVQETLLSELVDHARRIGISVPEKTEPTDSADKK